MNVHAFCLVGMLAPAAVCATGLASASQVSPPPQTVPPATAQPAPTPGAPATPGTPAAAAPSQELTTLVFASDVGIVINPVKPDKTGDFEMVIARLHDALAQSADPIRKQQAAGWKILKANEPGPGGSVLYLFIMDPAVKNADYTVSRILAEGFPSEVESLWTKLRDAFAAPMHRLTLQILAPPATEQGKSSSEAPPRTGEHVLRVAPPR
jgi:hypothetical protein